jgi:hypothetical protein
VGRYASRFAPGVGRYAKTSGKSRSNRPRVGRLRGLRVESSGLVVSRWWIVDRCWWIVAGCWMPERSTTTPSGTGAFDALGVEWLAPRS